MPNYTNSIKSLNMTGQSVDPLIGFHFVVVFFTGGDTPNSIDIRFSKVSGISASITTKEITDSDEVINVPVDNVNYDNLILERGYIIDSSLKKDFEDIITQQKVIPSDTMVTILDEKNDPAAAWLFKKTFPVKWSLSPLNASSNEVVIETLELKYSSFCSLKV